MPEGITESRKRNALTGCLEQILRGGVPGSLKTGTSLSLIPPPLAANMLGMKTGIKIVTFALALSALPAQAADNPRGMKVVYGESRTALVIGNSTYAANPLVSATERGQSGVQGPRLRVSCVVVSLRA